MVGLSFGLAAAFGVISFPTPGPGLARGVLEAVVTTLIFAVVFLGEEIGWRGFLLLRLCELMPARSAAVLTGACHAIYHVPLLTLTTTYQYAGSRWIVVPMVIVTITLAGVWYGWLGLQFGTIWPVSLSGTRHFTFEEAADLQQVVACGRSHRGRVLGVPVRLRRESGRHG